MGIKLMNIIIIDDDRLVALSLKTILEAEAGITVTALGSSGTEAIELYEKYNPDVLVMDIRMDGMNGLDASKTIITAHPDARILLLTTFSDDEYIIKALSLGAKGYILKQNFESIAPAVNAVCSGQTVFGDEIVGRIPALYGQSSDDTSHTVLPPEDCSLTEKERDIVSLVAEGMSNKEIAASLYLSEGTVRNYLSAILEKLQLKGRTQLACYYYKNLHNNSNV